MKKEKEHSIYEAKLGFKYQVNDIPDIELLHSLGVYRGAKMTLKEKINLGGPVVLEMGHRTVAIGKDIARQIFVREVV